MSQDHLKLLDSIEAEIALELFRIEGCFPGLSLRGSRCPIINATKEAAIDSNLGSVAA